MLRGLNETRVSPVVYVQIRVCCGFKRVVCGDFFRIVSGVEVGDFRIQVPKRSAFAGFWWFKRGNDLSKTHGYSRRLESAVANGISDEVPGIMRCRFQWGTSRRKKVRGGVPE